MKRGGLRNLGPVDEELLRVETGRVTVEPTVATECCRGKDRKLTFGASFVGGDSETRDRYTKCTGTNSVASRRDERTYFGHRASGGFRLDV